MTKFIALYFLMFYFFLNPATAFSAPIAVTVSIPPQKYFLEQIGGSEVMVTTMVDKGRDPHSYEPTAAQMKGVAKAELYFAIGVPFESQWLPRFLDLNRKMRVVSLAEKVERLQGKPDLALRENSSRTDALRGHRHHHGLETDDPHLWLSPKVMVKTFSAIVAALSEARPEKAAYFAERAMILTAKTRGLEDYINALFAPLHPDKRIFLTFHQSWTYYAHNFSLREVSVELGGREPGPKSLGKLLEFAKEKQVRVIVIDNLSNKAAAETIARSIDGVLVIASPLEENWPEALRNFSELLAKAISRTRS